MSRVSTRFRLTMGAMLLATAAAVGWLGQHPRRTDPCAVPSAISVTSQIPGSTIAGFIERPDREELVLWTHGTFEGPHPGQDPYRYHLVRSYDVLHLGTRPVDFISNRTDAERHRIESIEVDGRTIPIHFVEDRTNRPNQLIAYFHIRGLTPTRSLFSAHLAGLPGMVLDGAPLLTTIVAAGALNPRAAGETEESLVEWLSEAWRFFDRYCSEAPNGVGSDS